MDAGAGWIGGGPQNHSKWVRLPPASLPDDPPSNEPLCARLAAPGSPPRAPLLCPSRLEAPSIFPCRSRKGGSRSLVAAGPTASDCEENPGVATLKGGTSVGTRERRMSEREWLACVDPNLMLKALSGRVSDRILRLFAVACCRHIWHLLPDPRSRTAIEVAERYADGLAGERERAAAKAAAAGARGEGALAAYWTVCPNLPGAIGSMCDAAVVAGARNAVLSAQPPTSHQLPAW